MIDVQCSAEITQKMPISCYSSAQSPAVCRLSVHFKSVLFSGRLHGKTQQFKNVLNAPRRPRRPVCFFKQLSVLFCCTGLMNRRQRWRVGDLCLLRNASVRAQHECEKLRHANCQRGEGIAAAAERWKAQTDKYTPTGMPAQTQHSNKTVTSRILDSTSWLVLTSQFFFSEYITLVGLCYAAHQLSDDIILSEKRLLYLGTDSVSWLLPHQHLDRDWQRKSQPGAVVGIKLAWLAFFLWNNGNLTCIWVLRCTFKHYMANISHA